MTSNQRDIEVSYDVSNEFFRLWLDDRMHYTSASFLTGDETLEEAQINKCKILYDYAEMTPDKLILDIGCGWGANLEFLVSQGVKRIHGITLSTAQHEEIVARKLPGVTTGVIDYKDFEPTEKYDALVSIEMIDHLCSPAQSREGKAIDSTAPTSRSPLGEARRELRFPSHLAQSRAAHAQGSRGSRVHGRRDLPRWSEPAPRRADPGGESVLGSAAVAHAA